MNRNDIVQLIFVWFLAFSLLYTILSVYSLILKIFPIKAQTTITATVEQSEMRSCIEACGYEFNK